MQSSGTSLVNKMTNDDDHFTSLIQIAMLDFIQVFCACTSAVQNVNF